MVQWLRLRFSTEGGIGSILGWGTKDSYMLQGTTEKETSNKDTDTPKEMKNKNEVTQMTSKD